MPHPATGLALRALVAWLAIAALAIVNGLLREAILIPSLGDAPGLALSGILLCCIILALSYLLLPWLGARRPVQWLLIGISWLLLTLTFETAVGLLQGKSLAVILENYDFKDGNIWPVVLLVTAAAPWWAARLRGWG
ncbi:hypothetical protein [Parahaliea mediterranea]|uniref:Uncharacterized protein n=1 Tax=Parahaliea mediterranea TaxID=651086 RepID=A0A939DE71_9GAMM|nr:hypothetical protein [Parahaliea mediterranea]MBN7795892.1 hypothetical protein [Parahaliea mediterranea]